MTSHIGAPNRLGLAIPMSADAAPWTIADNHELTFVWVAHRGHVNEHPYLIATAMSALSAHCVHAGAIAAYSIAVTTAIDAGWMYVTIAGSAAVPRSPSAVS